MPDIQLIEKKGDKEVYRDRETDTKWVVKRPKFYSCAFVSIVS
jgi:hypothetical protein